MTGAASAGMTAVVHGSVSMAKVVVVEPNRTIGGSEDLVLATTAFALPRVGPEVGEGEVMTDTAMPPLPAVVVPLLHQIVRPTRLVARYFH